MTQRLGGALPAAREVYAWAALGYLIIVLAADRAGRRLEKRLAAREAGMSDADASSWIEDLHKYFGKLEVLRGIDLEVRAGRGRRRHRAERLWQVDAAALPELSRAARRRGASGSRASWSAARARRRPAAAAPEARAEPAAGAHRHGLPALQPVPAHDRARQRHRGADASEGRRRATRRSARGRASAGARRIARRSATSTRRASRAASSSASPSRGRWRWSRS